MRTTTYLLFCGFYFFAFAQQNAKLDSIKDILSTQSGIEKISSLNELAWEYKNFDVDSSIVLSKEAIHISNDINSKEGLSQSLNSLANAMEAKGNLDSALYYHQSSLELKQELNDSIGMAASLNNIGIAYDQLGKFNLSLESYFRSLRIYESRSDQPFDVAMVLGNIGIVYKKQKEYDKVLEYYEKALDIYKEVGSDFGQTVTKGNIGSVMLLTGDYEKAIQYAEEALDGYEKVGYLRYVPYMLHNIGIAYDSLGEVQKARANYLIAIDQHLNQENWLELASTHIALSSNYRKTSEHQASIEHGNQALDYAQQVDAKDFQANALLELSKSLAKVHNYRKAFNHLQRFKVLNDSLFEENKTKQIFELQTAYETEKKEQQIALQDAQIAEQEAQLERKQIQLIAFLVATILIISLALLQRSRLRKKQQLKLQEAQLKAREAEINATIASQENERARYARDLHDGFGQMISILNMNLKNLGSSPNPNERQKVFEESSRVIDEMYNELKNICFDLMPQTLIQNGLESALKEFADRINTSGNIFIELNVFGLEQRLQEIQEISLYRISQEWINNILKYSDAQKVTLQITKDDMEITLLIEDDGMGFDRNLLLSGKGNGWKNLNTRANLIKGELELETEKGKKGNTLILNAPVAVVHKESIESRGELSHL